MKERTRPGRMLVRSSKNITAKLFSGKLGFYSFNAIAYFLHRSAKLFLAAAEFAGPVSYFVIFFKAYTLCVLRPSKFSVIRHFASSCISCAINNAIRVLRFNPPAIFCPGIPQAHHRFPASFEASYVY